jgi:hypothetical protein
MSTPMDVRTLVILTAQGHIPAEEGIARIAEECGITTESLIQVLSVATRTPLASRRWTSEDDALVVKMWQDGKTAGTIAKAINRSRTSVSQRVFYLRRHGHDLAIRETAGLNAIRASQASPSQLKLPGF